MDKHYFLPENAYQILKWAGLIALPAIAVFIGTVGQAWGMDASLQNAVVTTLNAAGVLVGVLIGASQVTGKPTDEGGEDA